MPHYADGTPAKVGDLVLRREKFEHSMDLVGIVMTIQPGSTSCNAQVIPLAGKQKAAATWLPVPSANLWSVTLSECSKMDDESPAAALYDTKKQVEAALASG